MAIDKSEPRTALIAGIAVSSIVITIVLRMFLVSYFAQVHDEEVRIKSGGVRPAQLTRQRLLDQRRLEHGAMPITQAMNLAAGDTRPRGIWPEISTDYSALQGWSMRPTGWHAPAAPTIAPGPVQQVGAPAMQGGPSTDGTIAPSSVPVPVPVPATTTTTTTSTAPSPSAPAPAPAPPATEGAAAH
ncbi:MAG: hypothetical protein WCJ30_21045 [Deltaproteobacteria bacterium]